MEPLYYCKRCEKPVFENYGSGTFCSQSCANRRTGCKQVPYPTASMKDSKGNYLCLNCGKIISSQKYCNSKCQMEHQQKLFEDAWLSGKEDGTVSDWNTTHSRIRTYLFRIHNSKCSACGWSEVNPFTNTIPLEVEHIDGNPYNNKPYNLTLLCPNCHSLTRTYRGANRGHGRRKTWKPV